LRVGFQIVEPTLSLLELDSARQRLKRDFLARLWAGKYVDSARPVANKERDWTHSEVRSSTSDAGLSDLASLCFKASSDVGPNIFRATNSQECHAEIYPGEVYTHTNS
jgi:hypothetical protein